jgi:demethylsterigmatocystin 6-O-methyltransferase
MDSIVAQIKALADTADEAGRLEIIKTLQQVKVDLQTSKDVLMEIAGLVYYLSLLYLSVLTVTGWYNQCDVAR